jgi:flagellar hook-basal body complex protein FliE
MTFPAVDAVRAVGMPSVVAPIDPGSTGGVSGSSGLEFAGQLGKGLEWLQGVQTNADNLGIQAATGTLTDVHDYMIASTQASLATELTVAVRNKAVEAFSEIMRMQG